MREVGRHEPIPELKALVAEASQALALLDTARLEELALSCEALHRNPGNSGGEVREDIARQAREARTEMAVFGGVLEATRANVNVMKRLRGMRLGELEYEAQRGTVDWAAAPAGDANGND